jgi:hypothetical protein
MDLCQVYKVDRMRSLPDANLYRFRKMFVIASITTLLASPTLGAGPSAAKGAKLDSVATTDAVIEACDQVERSNGTEAAALRGVDQSAPLTQLVAVGKKLTSEWSKFAAALNKIKPAAPQDVALVTSAKSVTAARVRHYKSFVALAQKKKAAESVAALTFTEAEVAKEDAFQRSLASRADGQHCVALGDWEDIDLPPKPLTPDWFEDTATVNYSPLPIETQASLAEVQKASRRYYKAVEGRIMKNASGETLAQINVFLVRSSLRSTTEFDQLTEQEVGAATPVTINPSARTWLALTAPIPVLDTVFAQTGNAIITFAGPASPNGERVQAAAKEYLSTLLKS